VGSRYGSLAGVVFCSGFIPDLDQYPQLRTTRCPGGTTKLAIFPDGSVYPCNLLFGRGEYRLGNILADPFDSIWHHPALMFFRTFSGNACPRTACELHNKCHGGCPAHSQAHGGKLSEPDPRCVTQV
jgi:radical SAM protein with 4Fe4S-binding SPASM domain